MSPSNLVSVVDPSPNDQSVVTVDKPNLPSVTIDDLLGPSSVETESSNFTNKWNGGNSRSEHRFRKCIGKLCRNKQCQCQPKSTLPCSFAAHLDTVKQQKQIVKKMAPIQLDYLTVFQNLGCEKSCKCPICKQKLNLERKAQDRKYQILTLAKILTKTDRHLNFQAAEKHLDQLCNDSQCEFWP